MSSEFFTVSSRAAALHRLREFLERVPRYAHQRNFDRVGHPDVSRLSPWIRYRVISEEECVKAVLEAHSFEASEKFVQELMWRTYWKGWLELRPRVWTNYLRDLDGLRSEYLSNKDFTAASRGETRLSFFNDWVNELVTTGYLHNHTRMWFASVWIFTLQLPWQLGAEFMYRHLLDGDPASNTLSWRWVAGLQTKGKLYIARPDNIAKYSEGRWAPRANELNVEPKAPVSDDVGPPQPLSPVLEGLVPEGSCVLVHDDDLSVDLSPEVSGRGARFCVLGRDLSERAERVGAFVNQLRGDAQNRMNAESVVGVNEVERWTSDHGARCLYAMRPRCGYETPMLERLHRELHERGIELIFLRRDWDSKYYRFAQSGYFPFWNSVKKDLR